MGLKLSSLFSRKKTKKQKQIEHSPRTAQKLDNDRRTAKLIYPPLSSIPIEEPKRSLRPDGRLLYESPHINWGSDENIGASQYARSGSSSYYVNRHKPYNNGTFTVLSRHSRNDGNIFRV